jgi:AbrB family looped-hinge helix DNA binding protein
MSAARIGAKGHILLPGAVRQALGLKPGMRVDIRLEGKSARITLAPAVKTTTLAEIQALLKSPRRRVRVRDMRAGSQTLKRKCMTSPSRTTYSLPSRRIFPDSLDLASPPRRT